MGYQLEKFGRFTIMVSKLHFPANLETGIILPFDHPFEILKAAFAKAPEIRNEVELALAAVLERLNPSDRGTRFLTGGAYEWVIAVAAWASNIQVFPGGHSENGFDLLEYMESLKGLWSVKSFTSESLSGSLRIVNKMSPGHVVWTQPTVFISPDLPGIVYLDPSLAPVYASLTTQNDEAVVISGAYIKRYSTDNPNCVIPLKAPINQGNGKESPQLDIVASILTSGTYKYLGPVMNKMRQMATTVDFLRQQYSDGEIDEQTFKRMLKNLDSSVK
jgi:hypothetical protein